MQLAETLQNAEARLARFQQCVASVSYEAKGVLFSEMLFFVGAVGDRKPRQILESGRARAQSTLLLGLCFPESQIISIERDADSPDVAVAAERLAALPHVAPLFGNSNILLPELLLPGDVVLIDGPKGWHAVSLALTLLKTGRPQAVFVHDTYRSRPERPFLEQQVPGAFFSDDAEFVARFGHLDQPCWATIRRAGIDSWQPYQFGRQDQASYGPTLACLPYMAGTDYAALERRLLWERLRWRIGRSLKRHKRRAA